MNRYTYEEVIRQIETQRRFGSAAGVEVSADMLSRLSNPQQGIPFIHIAGTNGKGSVSAFLCAIFRAAGLKTGMFTSPHLVDFRERIQVNGEMISKEAAERLGNFLLGQTYGTDPAMFDYCLAMAALYFREQHCDVAVYETGLGGRLDSTNALGVPAVSVITKIGYDHTEILGKTLPEIAAEKAGIIKAGTHLVLESQPREVLSVLLSAAEAADVKSCNLVRPEDITDVQMLGSEQVFSWRNYRNLKMRLLGVHQYENAAAAILAAEAFFEVWNGQAAEDFKDRKIGDKERESCVRAGIQNAVWPGRMEILSEQPFFLVDGAHNGSGVRALAKSLRSLYPGEKFHFIMGVMADKDYEMMIEELLPLALDFCAVTVHDNRALQAEKLAECIRAKGVPAVCCGNAKGRFWEERLDPRHKTVAFGSLYFIGEIKNNDL